MFKILIYLLVALVAFYLGVIYGVKDCKKRFGIPKGCTSVADLLHNYEDNNG